MSKIQDMVTAVAEGASASDAVDELVADTMAEVSAEATDEESDNVESTFEPGQTVIVMVRGESYEGEVENQVGKDIRVVLDTGVQAVVPIEDVVPKQ